MCVVDMSLLSSLVRGNSNLTWKFICQSILRYFWLVLDLWNLFQLNAKIFTRWLFITGKSVFWRVRYLDIGPNLPPPLKKSHQVKNFAFG